MCSPIALQRKAFNDIKRVAFSIGLSFLPEDKKANPLWESLGYSPILQDEQYQDKQPWDEVDFKQHMVMVTHTSSCFDNEMLIDF